ncbi:MAG: hypothetical protein COT28_21520 [Methylobacterium sp. CG08_land_8_20_14_0_20_71_15]|nr:MAG: hypothetical protein COT56_06285 [Methylobacterium sp. CG09_land_8_20_14_0_10_71_15]PIU11151.1 MAG: hypothetical protein COT28_21520 [Methylobacterium sp. CG08_land_8_20_14_0_20_71_15]
MAQRRLGPAAERVFTPALSCSAVRGIVAEARDVVLATSLAPDVYERVYAAGGVCTDEVTAAPAFVPTGDDPMCFAGYRCRQRNNGDAGR